VGQKRGAGASRDHGRSIRPFIKQSSSGRKEARKKKKREREGDLKEKLDPFFRGKNDWKNSIRKRCYGEFRKGSKGVRGEGNVGPSKKAKLHHRDHKRHEGSEENHRKLIKTTIEYRSQLSGKGGRGLLIIEKKSLGGKKELNALKKSY